MASQPPPSQDSFPGSDELMDREILRLEDELQRVRKQRSLLQLRREIAREHQLLNEAEQGLDMRSTPTVAQPQSFTPRPSVNPPNKAAIEESTDALIQGIKRSHSQSSEDRRDYVDRVHSTDNTEQQVNGGRAEVCWPPEPEQAQQQQPNRRDSRESIQGQESHGRSENGRENGNADGTPPPFSVPKEFRGVNRKEYNALVDGLEKYFARYDRYYTTDARKVEAGLRVISAEIARAWGLCVVTNDQMEPTWSNFCRFLQSRIRQYVDPIVAKKHYYGRTQRHEQTVREFANHLGSWEQHLEELLTDEQRIQNLWEHVLPEVREAATPYQCQSNRFLDVVSYLQTVETRLPSRSHLQHKMGPRRHKSEIPQHNPRHNKPKPKQQHPFNGPKNHHPPLGPGSLSFPKHPMPKKPRLAFS